MGYDWSSITNSKTVSIGKRSEDSVVRRPMAWPEYKDFFTEQAPSYRRRSGYYVYLLCGIVTFGAEGLGCVTLVPCSMRFITLSLTEG